MFFQRRGGDGIAPFVKFDVVDEGLDGFAGEAAFPDSLGEDVAAFVALTELGDETVPEVALFGKAETLKAEWSELGSRDMGGSPRSSGD
ncbi:MAG: hypothetical protein ABI540_06880 [Spartobacteria bacterium]